MEFVFELNDWLFVNGANDIITVILNEFVIANNPVAGVIIFSTWIMNSFFIQLLPLYYVDLFCWNDSAVGEANKRQ